MSTETLESRDDRVVRKMILAPGEASSWHVDPCRRYTSVLGGSRLAIEFKTSGDREEFPVYPGMSGWDEPEPRVHRAVNTGDEPYIEVVTFLRSDPTMDIQPEVIEPTA